MTTVHPDKVPMVPGFGQQPRFIVTIQPSGALFNPPAPITLPNVDGLKPRALTEMYSFDHDIGSFVAIGTGTVSDDGQVIRSNLGVGVLKAGWHCGGDPSLKGTIADCLVCNICDGQKCVADDSQSPPQVPQVACERQVCSGGNVINVPDDSKTPSQNGAPICNKFICSGGIVDTAPDDGQAPPQVVGNCQAEVCLGGDVSQIQDNHDIPRT